MRRRLVAFAIALSSACGSSSSPSTSPDPWNALARAHDDNAASNVFETQLRAAEVKTAFAGVGSVDVWAYNGTVPGPLVEAHAGDQLVVHFKNDLPEPTTIHWHGVRVPAEMDGTPAMQSPISAGGTFDYSFVLRDAGLFWFHPHVRSDVQKHKGLYGVILVRGDGEPVVDREGVLVLDDITIQPDGTISDYLDDESAMLGREGKTLLVNGMASPTFTWTAGSLTRLRILNAANGRFFNLALPGYTWHVIGTDGGMIPKPYDTDHLLVAPGERYDVLLIATGAPGANAVLTDDPYERGHDTGAAAPMPIATFQIDSTSPISGRTIPATTSTIEPLADGAPDDTLVLNEGVISGQLAFTINGQQYPNVTTINAAKGVTRRWLIDNQSEMDHPFHLHGTFFQLLRKNGSPVDVPLANKDTIIVPMKTTIEIAAPFEDPGRWMYHCHIFEHAEGGMMGEVDVQ